ncbi:energy transducer TonB [Aurantiacibacter aquimixticola]|uniref:TonB C-terminal domain-containing protein n=1 Tax=Aurantiacibacter aquimixticola TaxID=1958945 RepID=A0A419RV06_9SPHN|nr:energy transducer TonB [Aurantiacibacter aquimixticola]RJY09623.1 hypothetical protein D6201_09865 [Aurantiacibacter aquimixticola]
MKLPAMYLALAAIAVASPAHAQRDETAPVSERTREAIATGEIYRAVGEWRLSSRDDGCSITRNFAHDGDRFTLSLKRIHPGHDVIQYALIGDLNRRRRPIEAGFVPGPELRVNYRVAEGSMGDREGYVYAGPLFMPEPDREVQAGEYVLAQATEYYVVQNAQRRPLVLQTGSMRPALQSLDNCLRDQLESYGVAMSGPDVAVRAPRVTNMGELSAQVSRNYPIGARAEGYQGIVRLRLIVDGQGDIVRCHHADFLAARLLREDACRMMQEHATFVPARNRSGEGVPGYFFQNIVYDLNSIFDVSRTRP